MDISHLSFEICSTGAELGAVIKFDGVEIFSGPAGSTATKIQHEFDDSQEVSHSLEITLQGKLPQHTKLDENNCIIQDSMLRISNFELDGIELRHLFFERCRYYHDSNGSAEPRDHDFWGDMGCNGTVKFEFSSPVYMWLLENM